VGVVCIHGFTGSPYDLRFLAGELERAGFADVTSPVLPGHLTTVDDLDRTTWADWVDEVERAIDRASPDGAPVLVVGQSLGGLLALDAAARHGAARVARVASLAAPLWLPPLSTRVADLAAARGWRTLPKVGGPDIRDRREARGSPSYSKIPVRALGELRAFMREVDGALPRIAQPVLVLHAAHDHTAPVACAQRIAERARARRLRILPKSYHLIASDVEREIVAAEVISFFRGAHR
jgi:carboxylesterase